ncbi:hypothetical protein B0H17DRAFT_1331996 [Mycena rosella]|uniref:Uncharacterized protein n=1 Tax=Mycena rosella TaxID=1033263 RepID=A0AAD7GHY8_MYCRO|nr:hypothetical protein B0H17DRAFT_1331996 [Mycena rosella]
MSGIGSFLSSFLPTIHAESPEKPATETEGPAEDASAEEPKEEPEDVRLLFLAFFIFASLEPHPEIRAECEVRADEAHSEKCQVKVQAGQGFKGEDCVERRCSSASLPSFLRFEDVLIRFVGTSRRSALRPKCLRSSARHTHAGIRGFGRWCKRGGDVCSMMHCSEACSSSLLAVYPCKFAPFDRPWPYCAHVRLSMLHGGFSQYNKTSTGRTRRALRLDSTGFL